MSGYISPQGEDFFISRRVPKPHVERYMPELQTAREVAVPSIAIKPQPIVEVVSKNEARQLRWQYPALSVDNLQQVFGLYRDNPATTLGRYLTLRLGEVDTYFVDATHTAIGARILGGGRKFFQEDREAVAACMTDLTGTSVELADVSEPFVTLGVIKNRAGSREITLVLKHLDAHVPGTTVRLFDAQVVKV